jgi:NAD+ kinase
MGRKVLTFVLQRTEKAVAAGRDLSAWLKGQGYEVLDFSETEETIAAKAVNGVDLGVVIGGDGTFLRLVRQLEKKDAFPLLGVNLGTLGFITEIAPGEMIPAVQEALSGKFAEQRRMLLDIALYRGGKKVESAAVFNDAVVTKEARTTMLKFDVRVGGELLSEVGADGYIVSTPTGSTAYGLSAGGPIIHPDVKTILLVPICSHALSARSVVVPESKEVEIDLASDSEPGFLVCDGQINFDIKGGDRITASVSTTTLRLACSSRQKWSEAIRSKLNMA